MITRYTFFKRQNFVFFILDLIKEITLECALSWTLPKQTIG